MAENKGTEINYIRVSQDPLKKIDPIEVLYKLKNQPKTGINPDSFAESKVVEGGFAVKNEVKKNTFFKDLKTELLDMLGFTEEDVMEDKESLVVPEQAPKPKFVVENNLISGIDFKSKKKDR